MKEKALGKQAGVVLCPATNEDALDYLLDPLIEATRRSFHER